MVISTTKTRQNRNALVSLVAVCCLGLVLFIIASVIVIALIPVYLSRRNVEQPVSVQSSQQQAVYSLPNTTTYTDGSLTQSQLDYLVSSHQTNINNSPITTGSTISSSSATVTSSPTGKRKRQTTGTTQYLVFIYRILFIAGTTTEQQNTIFAAIKEIIAIPPANFNFLTGSSQVLRSYPAVLYVWSGQDPSVDNAADFVAVVDFNENSATYGQILKTVPLVSDSSAGISQIKNEPHHASVSSDGRYYISGGLLSFLSQKKEIFVWNIPKNPANGPEFLYALDAPGGCVDEFLPIGEGKFLVSMMCNESAVSPGDIGYIDADARLARSFLQSASTLQNFNPHGFTRLNNGSVFTADYINPLTLTGNAISGLVFRDSTRHFLPNGALERTFTFQMPTGAGQSTGVGTGIGFMELKAIPNDNLGRSYACGTNDNKIHLMGPGMSEPMVVIDLSQVNSYSKIVSAGILSFLPDGKRAIMTFQMRYVILMNTTQPEKPVILRAFDFCTDSSLNEVKFKVPDSNQTTTFTEYCASNNNIVGSHVCQHDPQENRFVVVNYFLKFGLAQFAGTRTVHAFKLNDDLTNFEYDQRFNPNFQTQQSLTFHSLKAFPHHAQYLRLN